MLCLTVTMSVDTIYERYITSFLIESVLDLYFLQVVLLVSVWWPTLASGSPKGGKVFRRERLHIFNFVFMIYPWFVFNRYRWGFPFRAVNKYVVYTSRSASGWLEAIAMDHFGLAVSLPGAAEDR